MTSGKARFGVESVAMSPSRDWIVTRGRTAATAAAICEGVWSVEVKEKCESESKEGLGFLLIYIYIYIRIKPLYIIRGVSFSPFLGEPNDLVLFMWAFHGLFHLS